MRRQEKGEKTSLFCDGEVGCQQAEGGKINVEAFGLVIAAGKS